MDVQRLRPESWKPPEASKKKSWRFAQRPSSPTLSGDAVVPSAGVSASASALSPLSPSKNSPQSVTQHLNDLLTKLSSNQKLLPKSPPIVASPKQLFRKDSYSFAALFASSRRESPTRVLDFEKAAREDDDEEDERVHEPEANEEAIVIARPLPTKSDANENDGGDINNNNNGSNNSNANAGNSNTSSGTFSNYNSNKYQRKPKTPLAHMPTLPETAPLATAEDDVAHGSSSNSNNVHALTPSPRKKPPAIKKLTLAERAQQALTKAQLEHSIGHDTRATALLNRALNINKMEVARIKQQLKNVVGTKHPSTVTSINDRLYQDWIAVGHSNAQIRTWQSRWAFLQMEFQPALEFAYTAREVYAKQQKLLQQRPSLDATATQQHKETLETFIRRIRRAMEASDERRALTDEWNVLRATIQQTPLGPDRLPLLEEMLYQARDLLELHVESLGVAHPATADAASLMAQCHLEQGDMECALPRLQEAAQYILQAYPAPDTATTTISTTEAEEPAAASSTSEHARHPSIGPKLLQLGQAYQQSGQMDKARETLEIALPALLQQQDNDAQGFGDTTSSDTDDVQRLQQQRRRLLNVLNDLAVLRIGQKIPAVDLLEQALEVCDDMKADAAQVDTNNNQIHTQSVQIFRNLSESHLLTQNYADAAQALVEALDVQRRARQKADARHQLLSEERRKSDDGTASSTTTVQVPYVPFCNDASIGESLRRLGKVYAMERKNHDLALVVFKEALLIHHVNVRKALPSPKHNNNNSNSNTTAHLELPARQDQLAQTLYCVAEVHASHDEQTERTKALSLFGESLQLRLSADAQRNSQAQLNRVHCSMCLQQMASINAQMQHYQAACKLYRDALEQALSHGLPQNHPIVVMIQTKLEHTEAQLPPDVRQIERRADEAAARGDLDAAVKLLSQVMSIRKDSLKQKSSSSTRGRSGNDKVAQRLDTARTLLKFGDLLVQNKDRPNALLAYMDARKLLQKCRLKDPTHAQLTDRVHQALHALQQQQQHGSALQ